MPEEKPRLTKERILILASWFGVLVGVRFLLGFALENMWIGTLGAVAVTFAIFYVALRYSALKRFREVVNSALAIWYRRKFFYITGAISIFVLASLLFLIDYGHAKYGDRLITLDMTEEEFEETLRQLSGDTPFARSLSDNLGQYSVLDIMAITLASADKNFEGYYSKVVSFMFAEDIEIMLFLTIFRSRKEIFVLPSIKQG
ncbi:MAG: hypothetical protein ACRD99_05675 [Nitrososphaera sp.]